MRQLLFAAIFILSICASAYSQPAMSKVTVRAILVDKDLNQRPIPHLAISVTSGRNDPSSAHELRTDFAGNAEFQAPPGTYRMTTPQGVDYQGRHYVWDLEIHVGDGPCSIDISNDNARVTDPPPADPARKLDDLTVMFQKYQKSVVTVWSEIGSGTGFIVDASGLVMTNQHVIGPSELVSVQFDTKRKVAAKVLASDAQRDVAILYADLSAFPGAIPAPIAAPRVRAGLAVEGEKVFTIGSPLGLKKIITSGIVSKVEERAILSDVNINHGNSGGPLFNSKGEVIGITTFLVPGANGPGVAGIIRIEQALPVLEQARKKVQDATLPSARLLPVEPTDPYPLDSLKELTRTGKFDRKPYFFSVGGFDVALATPVLEYEVREQENQQAAQERSKRTKKRGGSPPSAFEPLQDLHEWAEYAGEYKPMLFVQASPQLRETFASLVGHELAPELDLLDGGPRMKFRADFYRMKLFCGTKEIEPIQPGKAATVVNSRNSFTKFADATYVGIYSYPPDSISPSCGKVALQLFSAKDPAKSETKELDPQSIQRVWTDFRPFVAAHGGSGN